MDVDTLFKTLDGVVILAIMAVTEGIKRILPESYWRWVPGIPLILGIASGVVMTDATAWRAVAKGALVYAGGASLGYELLRTTIFKKSAKAER